MIPNPGLVYLNERSLYHWISGVFVKPFFSMFGETFMGELTEYKYTDSYDECIGPRTVECVDDPTVGCLDRHTDFSASFRNFTDVRCPEKHKFVWILMGIFQVFGNALLLNLLVSMFSNKFEEVESNAILMWQFHRYTLLENYHAQPPFPPPFNLVYYAIRLLLWIASSCRKTSILDFEQFKKPLRSVKKILIFI